MNSSQAGGFDPDRDHAAESTCHRSQCVRTAGRRIAQTTLEAPVVRTVEPGAAPGPWTPIVDYLQDTRRAGST
ncbi:hypothetical protein [Corynebacterium sp. AOP12-C2-36]|uniref:hypothetical protein n=1 Tax=Corynebacterium sp. AOP12-C2-36 TaxID=3457723 RepID=UPI0040349CF7